MDKFMDKIKEMLGGTAGNIIGAIVVLIVGMIVIRLVMKALRKLKSFDKLEQTTTRFILNGIKWLLYVLLIIAVISMLGVPMAEVIAEPGASSGRPVIMSALALSTGLNPVCVISKKASSPDLPNLFFTDLSIL